MNVAFTICSNNYLAHAKTLADSFVKFNPDFRFYIGLVDKYSTAIDYAFFGPAAVVELNESVIPGFNDMIGRYNIVELNTAVKPFLFRHLIKKETPDYIYYFDPDIRVYQSIDFMGRLLKDRSLLLTPHFYTPVPMDGKLPFENMALNYGTYNLGFLGLNARHPEAARFLDWWSARTFELGYSRVGEGYFVDQLWINLAPIFFREVLIMEHYGCNMAPWNLHERRVKEYDSDTNILLNNGHSLVFYHFSSYDFRNPGSMSKYYDRFSFENMPEIRPLYDEYLLSLRENKVAEFSTISCQLPLITYEPKLKHKIVRPLIPLIKRIWQKI